VDDANVTHLDPARLGTFPLTGPGQRLYPDPSRDEMAEGLRDRGLQVSYQEPAAPVEDKPKPKPRGKKRKPPQQMQVTVKQPPKPKANRQELTSTLLELLGITLLTVGVGLLSVPAGFITLGICVILLGVALSTGPGS
jgi:hypothetical protein